MIPNTYACELSCLRLWFDFDTVMKIFMNAYGYAHYSTKIYLHTVTETSTSVCV